MKKLNFTLIILFLPFWILAQVGIGTLDVNPDALLELDDANKGLLLPRLDLLSYTDQVTVPSPEEGSMVYNLGGNIRQGMAYWDGAQWVIQDPVLKLKPDFVTSFSLSSQAGINSYKQVAHGLGEVPARVQVEIKADTGIYTGFIFQGIGSAQSDDDGSSHYSGVVYCYNDTNIRLWAPDVNNGAANGRIISVIDGWGGNVSNAEYNDASVQISAWKQWW